MPDQYGRPLPGEPDYLTYPAVMGAIQGNNMGYAVTPPSKQAYPAGYLPTPLATMPAAVAPPVPAANPAPTTTSNYGVNVPAGADPKWYVDFMNEHNGQTPEEVYHGDLQRALYDKAWGEQYQRTYQQPPSIYDWKASYGDRYRGYYGIGGGGGGGGGYGTSGGATNAANLPSYYTNWFATMFGTDPDTYYTQNRGGPQQAQYDYDALTQSWLNKTGRYLQPNEMQNLLTNALGHFKAQNVTPNFSDVLNYVDKVVKPVTAPEPVTYLNVGNI